MKKTDWALIILIVILAGVISYFVASALLPAPNKDPQSVPTAEAITSSVNKPASDSTIFNADAINPTVRVTIGDQSDKPPFTLGEN
jgi:hypothetical protein